VLIVGYILIGWLSGRSVPGWTSLMLVVVALGAVQMFVLALMGEYLGRLYNEAKRRPLYIIQEIAGQEATQNGRLGVIASRVSPPPVKGKGQKRRQNNIRDDRPPVRAVKPLDQ
jgi:hypothetical protein